MPKIGNPNPTQAVPLPRGRPKGVPNKLTQDVRAMIQEVIDGLGGAQRMMAWAKEDPLNERMFWSQVMPKLMPKEVNVGGQADNPLNVGIKVTFVDPEAPPE